MKSIITALAGAALLAASGVAHADGAKEMDSTAGKILVDDKGMTLYTFDKDTAGMSACYDKCAENWPPLMAAKDATAQGKYSIITRKDGSAQWAYGGKPLYLWVKDAKAGDMTGEGVNGVWHVAKP